MKVIIATDGSDHAVAAAREGLGLLAVPSTVIVACVVDAPDEAVAGMQSGFAGGMVEERDVERAWAVVAEEAEIVLDTTVAAIETTATVETEVLTGDAGAALCRLAAERDADVVVIGSRGRGAIKRALLGSVSQYVTNNAPCPVVVVRQGTDG